MYSKAHGAISLAVGLGLVVAGVEWGHPATWWVDPGLGLTTAVVLYAHVISDLVADVRTFEAVVREN